MTVQIDRDSTEYLYCSVTGTPPSVGAEVAFLEAGIRPTTWETAIVVPDDQHALWADAVAALGLVVDGYYIARLVGPFNANDVVLTQGSFQQWIRLSDVDERPIRIAPEAVEVL